MISLIAAFDKNRVIGKNGRLPWHISDDLKRFRMLTEGHTVIMGRRSYEEIGKPLPRRQTVVLTRDVDFTAAGCTVAHSLSEAISLAEHENIFIAGGASVYAEAMALCERLYLTVIDAAFDGDVYFPALREADFRLTEQICGTGAIPHRFLTYERIRDENKPEIL